MPDVAVQQERGRLASELRALVHDLRSGQPLPLQGGLTGTLASLATGLESRTGSQVRLSLANEPDLANTTKATLIRIAREALHNIAKHAPATHVDLVLEVGPTEVMLLVADDGRGTQVRIRVVRRRQ
jgi:signal transduction histidine kinase